MWTICENLRGFATSKPPLVLFMLCLGIFAVVLLSLAYVVKVKDLRNPDQRDWNDFLDGFKKVQFCMINDESDLVNSTLAGESDPLGHKNINDVIAGVHSKIKGDDSDSSTTVTTTQYNPDEIISVSLPLWVHVQPTKDFVNIPHNVSLISTNMTGSQMGMAGLNANTVFNVTFTVPYHWSTVPCKSKSDCTPVSVHTCVTIQAPAKFFPQSRKPLCQIANDTGVENHFKMVTKKKSKVHPVEIVCNSKTAITVNHQNDPSLTIMLSLQDRSAINLHLMHTSYFLFVMVITLLLYAIVRGRPPVKARPVQYSEVSTQA